MKAVSAVFGATNADDETLAAYLYDKAFGDHYDFYPEIPGAYAEALGPVAAGWPQSYSRAHALAALAEAAWQRGDTRDAADALPVYVRDKVALTTAEREQRA